MSTILTYSLSSQCQICNLPMEQILSLFAVFLRFTGSP